MHYLLSCNRMEERELGFCIFLDTRHEQFDTAQLVLNAPFKLVLPKSNDCSIVRIVTSLSCEFCGPAIVTLVPFRDNS